MEMNGTCVEEAHQTKQLKFQLGHVQIPQRLQNLRIQHVHSAIANLLILLLLAMQRLVGQNQPARRSGTVQDEQILKDFEKVKPLALLLLTLSCSLNIFNSGTV